MLDVDSQFDQRLIDYAPDGILAVDEQGRIFLVNQALCALTGYTSTELLGRALNMLLPPEIRAGHGSHLARYFSQPQARAMGEVKGLALWHREGRKVPVDIALGQCHRDGQPCALAFIRDVTEVWALRRRMEFQGHPRCLDWLEQPLGVCRSVASGHQPGAAEWAHTGGAAD